jgi:hypothetical protein
LFGILNVKFTDRALKKASSRRKRYISANDFVGQSQYVPASATNQGNYLSDWWDENSGTQVTSDADLFSAYCCMHSQKGNLDI